MKRLITILTIVAVLALMKPMESQAQFRPSPNMPTISEQVGVPYIPETSIPVLGFFDPSRFEMQHSYSLSFSSGSGPYSGSMGMYTNRMSYMISEKLMLIADVGFMHQPNQAFGPGGIGQMINQGQMFYGGELRYRPNENTILRVRFDNMPRYSSPYYGYGRGYNNSYGYGYGMSRYSSPFFYGY